jgi:hypothetical protein
MSYQDIISSCKNNLNELIAMVTATELAVLNEGDGTNLIRNNVNFFTKSFLLTLCASLETCIKDVIYSFVIDFENKLTHAAIPLNIVDWKFNSKNKKNQDFTVTKNFKLGMSKKDVDDLVSGNVYRTKDAFLLVGVNLSCEGWETWKELIQSIVTRRNNIVHHNDEASDLSFGDIKNYIQHVIRYLDFIDTTCSR